jgi:DNA-binding PadR family transcriptional regulator
VSPKEQLILRFLIDNPKGLYGSEFVSISQGKLPRGSIYTMLDRLVDKGYVREVVDEPVSQTALARTRHVITSRGMREYQGFLADHGLLIQAGAFSK